MLIALLGVCSTASAQPKKVNYQDDILPLFRNSCLNCHNPDKKKAGLDLSTFSATLDGSDDGKVVVNGDPANSKLYRVCARLDEPFMPQNGAKLKDNELAALRDWIAGGLPETAGSKVIIEKPKVDMSAVVTTSRPAGPPPMAKSIAMKPVSTSQHPWAAESLAASPWAPMLAVGGQHQILIYDTARIALVGVIPFPEGIPHVLSFSRNGQVLLAGGGEDAKSGKVVLFKIEDGSRVTAVGNEFDTVLAADLSPDQQIVALGGPQKVLKGYSTSDGELLYTIKKPTDWVTACAFSPDGKYLAGGDRAGNLYIYEARTGRDIFTCPGHKDAITALSFRDDSKILASASNDGTVKTWDLTTGAMVRSSNAHNGGVLDCAFAHDGKLVTAGRDNTAKLWGPDGNPLKTFEAFPDIALFAAINDDSTRVIAADWTGQIREWDASTAKRLATLSSDPGHPPVLPSETVAAATTQPAATPIAADRPRRRNQPPATQPMRGTTSRPAKGS